MKVAFVFPGQGAQYVGMSRDLLNQYAIARETFAAADEALGFSLTSMCLEGPEDVLRLTYHTQPALLTASVAAYRVLREHTDIQPLLCAGHSLGEYSALVAAGALPFEDAVKLVHARGRWMDEAVPAGQGAMAAVLGMSASDLEDICIKISDSGEVVEIANLNCPGQIVISGTSQGVTKAGELAKGKGARRVIPLVVSGPFHCSLMKPAAERLNLALEAAPFEQAKIAVVANVDAVAHEKPRDLLVALQKQLYSPVRWEDDVHTMIEHGVDTFVELGPGTVLSGLIKKINRTVTTMHVEDDSSLQEVLAVFRSSEASHGQ